MGAGPPQAIEGHLRAVLQAASEQYAQAHPQVDLLQLIEGGQGAFLLHPPFACCACCATCLGFPGPLHHADLGTKACPLCPWACPIRGHSVLPNE